MTTRHCLVCGRVLTKCPGPIGPKCARKGRPRRHYHNRLAVAKARDLFREVKDGSTENARASKSTVA
jgi:hypothetical protein